MRGKKAAIGSFGWLGAKHEKAQITSIHDRQLFGF